jgi:hypothetical protein
MRAATSLGGSGSAAASSTAGSGRCARSQATSAGALGARHQAPRQARLTHGRVIVVSPRCRGDGGRNQFQPECGAGARCTGSRCLRIGISFTMRRRGAARRESSSPWSLTHGARPGGWPQPTRGRRGYCLRSVIGDPRSAHECAGSDLVLGWMRCFG